MWTDVGLLLLVDFESILVILHLRVLENIEKLEGELNSLGDLSLYPLERCMELTFQESRQKATQNVSAKLSSSLADLCAVEVICQSYLVSRYNVHRQQF